MTIILTNTRLQTKQTNLCFTVCAETESESRFGLFLISH